VKNFVALATLFLLVTSWGCGASLPTEYHGRQALQEKLSEPPSVMKLVSFHKTNGKGDNQHYVIEFAAEIEFTADSRWGEMKRTSSQAQSPTVEVCRMFRS
jgi:hypothetical protein